jgi:hypothetical protein
MTDGQAPLAWTRPATSSARLGGSSSHPMRSAGDSVFAHRAGIRDAIRGHALQRGDGMAVVAEFRVVVVLDDHRCSVDRPREEVGASFGGEHDPRSGIGARVW